MQNVVVLGAGITGLSVALALSDSKAHKITVIERNREPGGLAATLPMGELRVDLGSHRVHSGYDPEALAVIAELLGEDLLVRPRRGTIRIGGRYLRYPPSGFEVLTSFGLAAGVGMLRDYLLSIPANLRGIPRQGTFEQYATAAVGRSLYERFYRPYARKLWGREPETLSFEGAMGRVKKFSMENIYKQLRAMTTSRDHRVFQYPREGFGQIADAMARRCVHNDVEIRLQTEVTGLEMHTSERITALHLRDRLGTASVITPDVVISTLPVDLTQELIARSCGEAVLNHRAGPKLEWRSLRIVYLLTSRKNASDHETFYFPEPDVLFGRVSEPVKYSPYLGPRDGRSLVAIEVPCSYEDPVWSMSDDQLARYCATDLVRVGILRDEIPVNEQWFTRSVQRLYPVHTLGWQSTLDQIFTALDAVENLFLVGRPALFLHCNIDHCIRMGLELGRLLCSGQPVLPRWRQLRHGFRDFALHD